jgi:hypothetical protein
VRPEYWKAAASPTPSLPLLDQQIEAAAASDCADASAKLEQLARNHYATQPSVIDKRAACAAIDSACESSEGLAVEELAVCSDAVADRPKYDWITEFRENRGGWLGAAPAIGQVAVLATFLIGGFLAEGMNAVFLVSEAGVGLSDRPWNALAIAYPFIAGLFCWQWYASAFQSSSRRRASYLWTSRLAIPLGFGGLLLYGLVLGGMHEPANPFTLSGGANADSGAGTEQSFKYVVVSALLTLAIGLKCGLALFTNSLFSLWQYGWEPNRQRHIGLVDASALRHVCGGWSALRQQIKSYREDDLKAEQLYVDQHLIALERLNSFSMAQAAASKLKLFKAG